MKTRINSISLKTMGTTKNLTWMFTKTMMMRLCTVNWSRLRSLANVLRKIISYCQTESLSLNKRSRRYKFKSILLLLQAWKKFDETKKRTGDILQARQRNMEVANDRAERQRQKDEEEMMRQAQNRQAKDQMRMKIDNTKSNFEEKVRRDVDYVKQEKMN